MGYQEFRGRLSQLLTVHRSTLLASLVLLLAFGTTTVYAQGADLGLLRVASFQSPRQVAPNSVFSVILDVEYATHGPENVTIRAAIYTSASVKNQTNPLWQSDSTNVTGGGDRTWNVSLTAPTSEGAMHLIAFAYYLNGNVWRYYNDSVQGPGYEQLVVKVARTANLEIDLGEAGLQVTVTNSTQQTSLSGSTEIMLPVGETYSLSVPAQVDLQNSTRLIFNGWSDGNNQSERSILLDGDVKVVGAYRHQYLLQVSSIVSTYSYSEYYDPGSNVTLQVETSVSVNSSLSLLGLKYNFQGWSGDVNSQSNRVNFTMNSPKSIKANFSVDYTPLVLPGILILGIIGAIVLVLLRRKRADVKPLSEAAESTSGESDSLRCNSCGEAVEKEWKHCIHCGADLPGSAAVNQ